MTGEGEVALRRLTNARDALDQARTLAEVKAIRDQAVTAATYVRAAKLGKESADFANEIRLRAEREAGRMLAVMPKAKGGNQDKIIQPVTRDDRLDDQGPGTLEDLGISKNQSSRWQKVAAIPDEVFEGYVSAAKDDDRRDMSVTGLRQAAAKEHVPEPVDGLITIPSGLHRAVVIDPPWPMKKIERDERPEQGVELDYPTMPVMCQQPDLSHAHEHIDRIACHEVDALEPCQSIECVVGAVLAGSAHDDCHLYLWVTHKFLPAGLDLLDAWGFRYQCVMTWRKNVGITPFSWMYDTEHVLFATRGSLPLERKGLRLSFEAPVQGHSIKPDVFYERVLAASPEPRLEMFARRTRDGFVSWGNEVGADVV